MDGFLMKLNRLGVIGLASVALLSGCATTHTGTVTPAPEATTPTPTMPNAGVAGQSEIRHLNMKIVVQASDKDARQVVERLRNAVQGRLTAEGYTIADTLPDVNLYLEAEAKVFDQSGNYYVFDGEVETEAKLVVAGKMLGTTTMNARSERKLGRAEALRALAEELEDQLMPWVQQTLSTKRVGLRASHVTVTGTRWTTAGSMSDYANRFVPRVEKTSGVVDVRVIGQDYENKRLVFRVVYQRDSFPSGLINYLATLDDLEFTPAQ